MDGLLCGRLTVIERIALLIHIIRLVVRHDADESEYRKSITVRMLEKAAERATKTWFRSKKNPSNTARHIFLREIIRLAALEERHWKGQFGTPDSATSIPSNDFRGPVGNVASDSDSDNNTLIVSTTTSPANEPYYSSPAASSLSTANHLLKPTCQHHHCTTAVTKFVQNDYPVVPLDYLQSASYDHAMCQRRPDMSRLEREDNSAERQHNLFSFTRQQQMPTAVSQTAFYPALPELQEAGHDDILLDLFGGGPQV